MKKLTDYKKKLSGLEYAVTREGGTEPAFSGKYWDLKTDGLYKCICCEAILFSSVHKFDSGTGWPSFWDVVNKESILDKVDRSHGMSRVEVKCSNCDAHLGHLFSDGPAPTLKRYCINSASLIFTGPLQK